MSVAIFGNLGIMVQTVRKRDSTLTGSVPANFSSNFMADRIEWL